MGRHMGMVVLMVVLMVSLLGCPKSGPEPSDANETTTGQLKEKADEALQASANYLAQQKEKLLRTSQEQLDKLEEQFASWADEVDTEDAQVRQKLSQLSERFKTALGRARQTVDEAGALGLEAWRKAKPDLEAALKETRSAYDAFIAYVETPTKQPEKIVEE